MTKIKICGITNLEDALKAAELSADYIGFIFSKSPRQISPEICKSICQKLSASILKVGVFVNVPAIIVNQILDECGLDMAQLHGEESPQFCSQIKKPVLKVFRLSHDPMIEEIKKYENAVSGILLDRFVGETYGGTGKTFDWNLVNEIKKHTQKPIIVSGGLNPQNLAEAIFIAKPFAVDISSGVESKPGKKDHTKLKQVIEIAHTH